MARSALGQKGPARFNLTGVEQLDRLLAEMAAEEGVGSINAELRKGTRQAMKEIVLPRVQELIPVESGFLESELKVRAIPRSREKIGHRVGFEDPIFVGDTYYAGFLEYGFSAGGTDVPPDSFLRRALYENEQPVVETVRDRMRKYVATTNRRAPTTRL